MPAHCFFLPARCFFMPGHCCWSLQKELTLKCLYVARYWALAAQHGEHWGLASHLHSTAPCSLYSVLSLLVCVHLRAQKMHCAGSWWDVPPFIPAGSACFAECHVLYAVCCIPRAVCHVLHHLCCMLSQFVPSAYPWTLL